MDFKERLAAAIAARDSSQAALARGIGVSVQAISMAISGATKALTAENTAKVARHLRVDFHWLATGEGQMDPLPSWPLDRIRVERYLALGAEDRAYVQARFEAAIESCERNRATNGNVQRVRAQVEQLTDEERLALLSAIQQPPVPDHKVEKHYLLPPHLTVNPVVRKAVTKKKSA